MWKQTFFLKHPRFVKRSIDEIWEVKKALECSILLKRNASKKTPEGQIDTPTELETSSFQIKERLG